MPDSEPERMETGRFRRIGRGMRSDHTLGTHVFPGSRDVLDFWIRAPPQAGAALIGQRMALLNVSSLALSCRYCSGFTKTQRFYNA